MVIWLTMQFMRMGLLCVGIDIFTFINSKQDSAFCIFRITRIYNNFQDTENDFFKNQKMFNPTSNINCEIPLKA